MTDSKLTPDLAVEFYELGVIKHMLIIDARYKHTVGHVLDSDAQKVRDYLDKIAITDADPKLRLPIRIARDMAQGIIAFPGEHIYPEAERAGGLPLVSGGPDGEA